MRGGGRREREEGKREGSGEDEGASWLVDGCVFGARENCERRERTEKRKEFFFAKDELFRVMKYIEAREHNLSGSFIYFMNNSNRLY